MIVSDIQATIRDGIAPALSPQRIAQKIKKGVGPATTALIDTTQLIQSIKSEYHPLKKTGGGGGKK